MKRYIRLLAIAVGGICFGSVVNAQAPIQQTEQRARIRTGVRDGSLTRTEAKRLRREGTAVRKQTRRDRLDGGRFTARERAKDKARARAVGRDIRRLKHNGRTR